jgi:predicted porin
MKRTTSFFTLLTFLCIGLVGLVLTPAPAQAQALTYETDDGWSFQTTGRIPVFLNASSHENFSENGDDQFATRIMSGFIPGELNFMMSAPTQNGVDVSAMFQINHHLQGPGLQNDGLFEGRIVDIIIAGNFGTFNIGKGFGIFNATALGDAGSGTGVGRFLGPDYANATLGRIGTGYTYANFNPRITYSTPDLNGFGLTAGLINPENPALDDAEIETATPRVEGQIDYTFDLGTGSFMLWAGGMYQQVTVTSEDFDYNMSGWDVGGRLNAAGIGLSGSFSQTNSVGADGLYGINLEGGGLDEANVDATQWYVEGTYDFGGFVLGASYGEGDQDAETTQVGSSPAITNELLMIFSRYMVNDNLTFTAEFQDFASDAQNDYNAFILGAQLTF